MEFKAICKYDLPVATGGADSLFSIEAVGTVSLLASAIFKGIVQTRNEIVYARRAVNDAELCIIYKQKQTFFVKTRDCKRN